MERIEGIKCPEDLNGYTFGILEPFKNTYEAKDCEMHKFYGDCFHCIGSAIAERDRRIKEKAIEEYKTSLIKIPGESEN